MNPDYMIEHFWLDFKASMINFYQVTKIPSRPINYWSNDLNILQSLKQYIKIKDNINNYISLYAFDVMRCQSFYYIGILMTNIKRWDIISEEFNNMNYYNIIHILVDIYHNLLKNTNNSEETTEINNLFSIFEIYIINKDFTQLISYSVENNKPNIIDKLKQSNEVNITRYIKSLYRIDINNMITGKKIIQLIKNEK